MDEPRVAEHDSVWSRSWPNGSSWIEALTSDGAARDSALFRLRTFLVGAAWFEIDRRRTELSLLTTAETAHLTRDAAEAAYERLLERLDDYHGQSRFHVWAAKFAIHEAATAARRIVLNGRKTDAARRHQPSNELSGDEGISREAGAGA